MKELSAKADIWYIGRSYMYMSVSVYNPHPYFTATGAVHAWPNTNVTSHKLTFNPGSHIYIFFLCILVYVCVADMHNEYLWIFSKFFFYTLRANCFNENSN